MVDFQQHVVFVFAAAASFENFHRHGAGNHVARSQVFHGRGVAFHKALAVGVEQDTAFAAHAFGNQHAGTGHTGGVKLPEFHVFQRNAGAGADAQAVAGVHKGIGGRSVNTAGAAGGKQHGFGVEDIDFAGFHFHCGYADHVAVFVADQVKRRPFDEKLGVGAHVLLVQGVQHGVAGTVGHRAGALYRAFAELGGVAAEGALVDFAAFHAVKGHAHVFELNHRSRCGAGHKFNGVLVAEPVGTFDGVVHMPVPAVFLHIAQRGGNAALRRHGVRAGGENFG